MVNALEKPQNLSANRIISIPLASYMSRDMKNMSEWARNLMLKVRYELSSGTIGSIGSGLGIGVPVSGHNYELDQHYRNMLDDKEQRITNEEDYRRLVGSTYAEGIPGGEKFALAQDSHNNKYTKPLTYEEIEAIEDITKEKK